MRGNEKVFYLDFTVSSMSVTTLNDLANAPSMERIVRFMTGSMLFLELIPIPVTNRGTTIKFGLGAIDRLVAGINKARMKYKNAIAIYKGINVMEKVFATGIYVHIFAND